MISFSDRGRAMCAIEVERAEQYAKARRLAESQQDIIARAQADQRVIAKMACEAVAALGKEHEIILSRLAALDEAAAKVFA